jgi:nitrogen fixation/metabolism regulation signal transduction histidine kinase
MMQRLRTRLIAACLCVALLPAVPLSLVVRNLLERSFSPARDAALERALEGGLAEARGRLQEQRARFSAVANERWLSRIASGEVAAGVLLLTAEGSAPLPAPGDAEAARTLARLARWGEEARAGHPGADPGTVLAGPELVSGHMVAAVLGPDGRVRVLAQALPAEMAGHAQALTEGIALLSLLERDRGRVLRSYVGPFLLVYGLLLGVAGIVGALLARRLARPLEALAAGTRQVAEGDLETRIAVRASGEVGDLVAAFNAMVERLAAQRHELARLAKVAAWRDMARTLAHEIKNPLTPILLAVQSAREGYRGEDAEHRHLLEECEEIVREEVEGLRNLVREFSEFARLPQPRLVPGDLRELLAELGKLYGERLQVEMLDLPRSARFDAGELRRALINLIDNGLAACEEAGRPAQVTLSARFQDGGIALAVHDEGAGIAPEDRAHIFEPEFSTKKEGMGLGLAIVEGIVTGHGGTLEVQSEVGAGTTFTLHLPAGGPDPVPAEESP